MNSITIILIVVVVFLTAVIFALTWLGYSSCLKMYKMEVSQGKHDSEIYKELHEKKKHTIGTIMGLIASYSIIGLLTCMFAIGVAYKIRGENFVINNQTALVIKSGSMSDFYSDSYKQTVLEDTRYLQFDVGDICFFETVNYESDLVPGQVYGYKYKNTIITHRLIEIDGDNCLFRGDNNPIEDRLYAVGTHTYTTTKKNVLYHYLGKKIPGIGAIVLYAQSYFGIWSLVGIIGIIVSSEIVYYKIIKINKARDKQLGGKIDEK